MERLKALMRAIRDFISECGALLKEAALGAKAGAGRCVSTLGNARGVLMAAVLIAVFGYWLYTHPPIRYIDRGEIGMRVNHFTGRVSEQRGGSIIVISGVHDLRVFPLRDRTYRPVQVGRADGPAPLQSVEGLSLGVDLSVRYAVDPARVSVTWKALPDDIEAEIVQPAVQGVIYKIFARYATREIFSTKRVEIQRAIEEELRGKLAADGILLRSVLMGKVDLPPDYRRGMEALLAEELASEKMRYTLELKDKRVKETALEAEAQKVRREKAAEASAREQIIAARAQEEAMKHVLPLRQRQIEQRKLEAEAARVARVKNAEGSAEARKIEASGEAEARQKLAEAEAYRLERIGKVNADQMAREGALLSTHPLLIQKTLADKLSDKIQVIIAPPPADGGFIGATLLGGQARAIKEGR